MRIIICGGNGFIGKHLTLHFLDHGHEVVILDRNESQLSFRGLQSFRVDLLRPELFDSQWFRGVDAVVNLSGKDIFTVWNKTNREAIRQSRITVNRNLISYIAGLEQKPKIFVSASAVGYYGNQGGTVLTEDAPNGKGFLAEVCVAWEAEARKAEQYGMRSVQVRTAPVLAKNGGMMTQVLKSFDFGISFLFGSGNNWFPWIHITDLVRIYHFVIEQESLSGPVNASSPNPVLFRDFMDLLRKYRKALLIRVPSLVLKVLLGETADVMVFSQKMSPAKLQQRDFRFLYPTLPEAFHDVFLQSKPLPV